ncbi:MAG: phosphoribosylformylglycinamidine synthase subunit PurQ [Bacteroidetes bacterium]|nr:MAG: phosphoribosylformylglycinamidine synthase subunit PurQ [Bacteroidota bacterium]
MSSVRFGIVVFPGSNCDHDAYHAVKHVLGHPAEFLWHKETDLKGSDVIILPGGFSYGDYLRTGAIARFSPVMNEVVRFARQGGVVMGICNGFQILCEAGLLPGVLMRNTSLRFACRHLTVRTENPRTRFTAGLRDGEVLNIPIAHGDGNYFADDETVKRLEGEGRVLFRYCAPDGTVDAASNPNGSVGGIAGIINETGTVMGMMPHPERACEERLGSADGVKIFASLIGSFAEHTV